ncbi:MAG TPA: hypothetical protein VFQ41_01555 [Candidatus Angelobacter sp.]|nr:hypothetical protein [Candidatus Angelobacter sp.]
MLRAFQLGKTSIADDLVFPSEAGTPICPDNIGPRDMELDAQISSMRYLLKTERMNDGIARALLVIFKVLAQTEDPRLMPGLGGWAEELMASINIGKLNKGGPVATNLLIALERASPGYLAAFAGKCCKMQPGNICSIARAIKKAEGSQSLLLQQMLNAEWCPPEAKTLILSFFRV